MIQGMTTSYASDGSIIQGVYRPGFLNMFDGGLRIILGPVVIVAEVGVNNIYVYHQKDLPAGLKSNFGANLRLGAGLKFGWWGVSATGTAVFPSFQTMLQTFSNLGSETNRAAALDQIVNNLVPSLMATLYF